LVIFIHNNAYYNKTISYNGNLNSQLLFFKNNDFDNSNKNKLRNKYFSSVGGFSVLATGNKDGFKFTPHMRLISP